MSKKFEMNQDVFIQSEHIKKYASKLNANDLVLLGQDSGYSELDFQLSRLISLSADKITFLTFSFDRYEGEFIVGFVYITENGMEFPGCPVHAGYIYDTAIEIYKNYSL